MLSAMIWLSVKVITDRVMGWFNVAMQLDNVIYARFLIGTRALLQAKLKVQRKF